MIVIDLSIFAVDSMCEKCRSRKKRFGRKEHLITMDLDSIQPFYGLESSETWNAVTPGSAQVRFCTRDAFGRTPDFV